MKHIKSTPAHNTLLEKEEAIKQSLRDSGNAVPVEGNFTSLIDHWVNYGNASYNMRYIIDNTYYNQTSGPILFYAGNEGDVWTFYNNSGFVTETLA
jgi:hypothetical protein